MQFTLSDAYNLNVGAVFGELIKVSPEVRKAAYRDQEWRTRAFEDLEQNQGGMKPRWETFEVSESDRYLSYSAVGSPTSPVSERYAPGRDV